MPFRDRQLFQATIKYLSECITHLHDTDLSPAEQKARELVVSYCDLLVKRFVDPNYGKDNNQVTK